MAAEASPAKSPGPVDTAATTVPGTPANGAPFYFVHQNGAGQSAVWTSTGSQPSVPTAGTAATQPDTLAYEVEGQSAPVPARVSTTSFVAIDNFLAGAKGADIQKLMALPSFSHVTMAPGDVMVVPAGYTVLDKVMGMPSFGLKRVLCPRHENQKAVIRSVYRSLDKPPRGGVTALMLIEKMLALESD